jgi:hypothetical protein
MAHLLLHRWLLLAGVLAAPRRCCLYCEFAYSCKRAGDEKTFSRKITAGSCFEAY